MTFCRGAALPADVSPLMSEDFSAAGGFDTLSEVIGMRQLRHQTKNALQRLLIQIDSCAGLQRDATGRALAAELGRRICLTATLSDALFGLTNAPGPLGERLEDLCSTVIALMGDGDQMIGLDVSVDGDMPNALADVIVRVTHELVGNAVKHGLHLRMVGRIEVRVIADRDRVMLTVRDDGWGFAGEPARGEGLQIAHMIARQHGGHVRLSGGADGALAELALPRGAA